MTPDDPQCDPNWPQHCGGFLLTVPTEGILAVVLTWNPEVRDGYPLDFDVFDPERKLVWYSAASGLAERRVQQVQVQAGVTYPIAVWSAYMPGEPFEISMSFLPK